MKFYDELTKTAVFTSVRELLHGINCMSERKVDEHSGHLTLRGLRITDADGVGLAYTNPIEIFTGLKEDFGLPVNVAGSVRRGMVFRVKMAEHPNVVYSDMQVKPVATTGDVVGESPVEDAVEITEDPVVAEPVVEDQEVTEDVIVEGDQPDWEWIGTLENKKYDKVKLDEYADKEFGIKLNRVMKLENMVADFKKQLSEK